jgi:ribosomal protein S10
MINNTFLKRYKLKITSFNLEAIKLLEVELKKISTTKIIKLPKKKKRFTFNRSPHVNSKAKEHFTIFTYKRLVYLSFQEFTHLSELLSSLSNDLSIVIKKNS